MGTAVVTGARGIGYEVGRSLARGGMRVIFGVRNLELGERALNLLTSRRSRDGRLIKWEFAISRAFQPAFWSGATNQLFAGVDGCTFVL